MLTSSWYSIAGQEIHYNKGNAKRSIPTHPTHTLMNFALWPVINSHRDWQNHRSGAISSPQRFAYEYEECTCRLRNIAMRDYQESVTTGQTHTRTHTHTRTDRQTPDKVIPMCRYAPQATQKSIHTQIIRLLWIQNVHFIPLLCKSCNRCKYMCMYPSLFIW